MVRKTVSQLRNKQHSLSDSLLAEQIGEALRLELGASRRATKTVMRWTGVSDTTARSWINGRASPSGLHLLELAAHSEPVMIFFLEATDPIITKARDGWVFIVIDQMVDSDGKA